MTYIITISLVVGLCMVVCALSNDDDDKIRVFFSVAITCLFFGAVLSIYYNLIYVSAEDYLNNPSDYQLDTIGTHINVTKISKL